MQFFPLFFVTPPRSVSKASPDELLCQSECSSEGGEALFSQWKVYFSLVNRHGCISLSLTPPSPLRLTNLHLFPYISSAPFYLCLPLSLSLPPIWSCTEDRLRVLFFFAEFFCHAVILKVPFCSCVRDKSKHFSTAAINALALFQQLCLFPPCLTHRHTLFHTHTFSPLSFPEALVLSWTLTSDSLPPAVHSSGRDLHLICISLQI